MKIGVGSEARTINTLNKDAAGNLTFHTAVVEQATGAFTTPSIGIGVSPFGSDLTLHGRQLQFE